MNYPLLDSVNSPEDLKRIPEERLPELCKEIRSFLINTCEKNGGHLASNLGAVELSVALHRVFSSPSDHIIFDVGHQSYVHKLITGRRKSFESLRRPGGLSGFTKREESAHDPFGAGHSSTALSAALGFAEADKLKGNKCYTVAVVGDGAFTGGMVHEALNNCRPELPLILILNENGMSISSNKGAFASFLTRARLSARYKKIKERTRNFILGVPLIGKPIKSVITYFKRKFKDLFLQSNYFEELGLHYIGPYDGNDPQKVITALELAKNFGGTVVVHLVTRKGCGYKPAERYPSTYHSVGSPSEAHTFHSEFARNLIGLAEEDERIVAITAAMGIGTGLDAFEAEFPDRYFDVGIAEGHALTFAAGLSAAGLSPYVAVYSTFLQRGYDSILHDIALQGLPVKIMIDRAGLSIGDGATHHGIFDVSMLMHIPSVSLFAPISFASLSEILNVSKESDAPLAVRYPNSAENSEALGKLGFIEKSELRSVLSSFSGDERPEYLFLTYGKIFESCLKASERLNEEGYHSGVIVTEWIKPYKPTLEFLLPYLGAAKRIVLVEEGIRSGGLMEHILSSLAERGISTSADIAAIDDNFASPKEETDLYEYVGLSADALYNRMLNNDKKQQ